MPNDDRPNGSEGPAPKPLRQPPPRADDEAFERDERRRRVRRNIVIAAGVLVAVNAILIGGLSQRDTPSNPSLPVTIQGLIPDRDQIIRPQDDVGADLQDQFTGVLIIDSHEIPQDQYDVGVASLGVVDFRPGPNKDIHEFAPGRHEITVVYWPRTTTREQCAPAYGPIPSGSERLSRCLYTYGWSFSVG